jgi:hypothetical protein
MEANNRDHLATRQRAIEAAKSEAAKYGLEFRDLDWSEEEGFGDSGPPLEKRGPEGVRQKVATTEAAPAVSGHRI